MSDERKNEIRVRLRGDGYSIEGPGFYVWDLDRAEVVRAAGELSRGRLPDPAPCRMLVIPGEDGPGLAPPDRAR